MYKKDPVPDIQRLEQLAEEIRRGAIRLPKFQRPFVWDREDMLNLWDSIYNGYPIGSVLLWHSSEPLKSEREIYGFAVREEPLDGQQRLTTVCGALYWDGSEIDSPWAIHFDLDTEKFVYPKSRDQPNLFPLNKLLGTSDFIRQCMRFESSPNKAKYYAAAEMLLRSVKDYKVAVVKIGDVTINEVAPIFERINSTGRKLTMVDLMRAATWKEGFDLNQYISDFQDSLGSEGFKDIPESVILRGVSAAAGRGINKGDIDGLRDLDSGALKLAFESSKASTIAALNFLLKEVGVDDFSYLPYAVQLTYFSEFFRLASVPTADQQRALTRWFWATSVTRYFGGASTGQNTRDLAEVRDFAAGRLDGFSSVPGVIDLTEFLFEEFNLRTALSTAFGLMLRKLAPALDVYGNPIILSVSQRKNRSDFQDLFKGSLIGGKNVGQSLRGQSKMRAGPLTDLDVRGNLIWNEYLPTSAPHLSTLERRARVVSGHIADLTGQTTQYLVPGYISRELL